MEADVMEKCSGLRRTLIGLAVLVFTAAPTWAADDAIGKVSVEIMSVGVGLGGSWGNGVLQYRGHDYPFTITGFSIGEVGAVKVVGRGEVYDLHRVEDFDGVFMAAMVGATVGAGAGAAAMQNQNKVRMVWTAANQGVSFSHANSGMRVRLTEAAQQAARNGRNASAGDGAAATPRVSQ
jgi:hypothetical protein